jgi:hypothetical protein
MNVGSVSEEIGIAGVTFGDALETLDAAVAEIYASDSGARSVGIVRHGTGFGYRVVRNSRVIRPLRASPAPLTQFDRVPVRITEVPTEVRSLARIPHSGPGGPGGSSTVSERDHQRPLTAGLQIQNFDDDRREGHLDAGFITIGTLGCFVRTDDGSPSLVSNNHVIAAENRGRRGEDRILQPGSGVFDSAQHIATLGEYVDLLPSPPGARPHLENVVFNTVDAGLAALLEGAAFTHGYLPARAVPAPSGVASAAMNDRVFKVGRTTGLTFGTVTDLATVVGPVSYAPGECWFRRSIVVEGMDGTLFSDHGDSGSAVLTSTGQVIGLLYAGNGQQTYICPIDEVLRSLNCALA